jgi:hypothetical protein
VPLTNYYELLDIAPTAPMDEVKKSFRQQIALYHPDKVHHLGKEFQAMAAERAAALTEAYRILSHEDRRAAYDKTLAASGAAGAAAPSTAPQASSSAPASESAAPPRAGGEAAGHQAPPKGGQFTQERASVSAFVRQAAMGRFRQALDAVAECEHTQVAGFDFACLPRPAGLFSRSRGPRLLGRFVPVVDPPAVAETWGRAAQWAGKDDACVFLIGPDLGTQAALASAIAEQRRKTRTGKITLIPVDARTWDAYMPVDAPAVAKSVLTRLRSGA